MAGLTLENRQWLKQVAYAGQRAGTVDALGVISRDKLGGKTELGSAQSSWTTLIKNLTR